MSGYSPLLSRPLSAPGSWKEELFERLQGVHNFLTTPFLANYDLDVEGVRGNVAYHARASTRNMVIVVGGGLGELHRLGPDEQKALAEAAVAGARGRLPVVVGGGGGFGLALEMARNAQNARADALLLFPVCHPYEDAEGQYEYFRKVATSVDIPVLLYPQGQFDFWPEVLALLAELPNVIGFKDGTGGTRTGKALNSMIPNRLLWIAEGETHALKAVPFGARAYTSAVATFVPEATRAFWQAGVSGDSTRMREIYATHIEPVMKVRSHRKGYGISGIKVAPEALGRAGGPVRPPGTQVLTEDRAKIGEIARKYSEPAGENSSRLE